MGVHEQRRPDAVQEPSRNKATRKISINFFQFVRPESIDE
jgi:hypothetical protein